MQNREVGSTKKPNPMTEKPKAQANDLVSRRTVPSKTEEAIDKLVTAYNSKAYANPDAPLLARGKGTFDTADGSWYSTNNVSLGDRNGNRYAFASKDIDPQGVYYHLGNDFGNPDRGVFDASVDTPLGTAFGGFEGETNHVGYSYPGNETMRLGAYYNNGFEFPIEASASFGTSDVDGGKTLYADLNAPFIKPVDYGSIDTPLGSLSYGATPKANGYNGYAYAEYEPNSFVKALANLLYR